MDIAYAFEFRICGIHRKTIPCFLLQADLLKRKLKNFMKRTI
jgi:hypothetical protein